MEYSVNAVANKMILVIVGLSVVITVIAIFLFMYMSGNNEAVLLATFFDIRPAGATVFDVIPFAAGVFAAMCLNTVKVILMKRSVNNSLQRESTAAKNYLKMQYFLRLVLTGTVFLILGLIHFYAKNEAGNPQYVNLMGTVYGIFTFPLSVHSMRFFFKDALTDNPELLKKSSETSATQHAINELKSIGESAADDE
jgi:hypothetical protein